MSFVLDRSLLSLILGPIVGILVMTGKISAACTNDVTNALSLEVGALIFITSLGIGAFHHSAIVNPPLTPPSQPASSLPKGEVMKTPVANSLP